MDPVSIEVAPPEALTTLWADLLAHASPRDRRSAGRHLLSLVATILLSSGFHMVLLYLLEAQTHRWRLRPICMLIEKVLFHWYGCYVPCSVLIGRGLWVPHPMGIDLNRRARLGRGVWLRQKVEVVHVWDEHANASGIIGDRCELGSGAILIRGGNVGQECLVGARAVVTKTVPPGNLALGIPATWRPLDKERRRTVDFVRR